MSESKWSNKQLLLEAESIVVGRYGIDATYKALQTMRDDMQATIDDLRAQLAFKEGLIRQLTEVDMPALEQQLAKAIESNDGLRAEFVRVAMQKGIAESQLATLQAAKPVGLDVPDGDGWWTFERKDKMPIRAVVCVLGLVDGKCFYRVYWSGLIDGTMMYGSEYFDKNYHGKWTRLHMPWDTVAAAADPDARTVTWEDIPDGKYEDDFEIETRPGCRKAVVTYCGDSMGIIKRYLWIPDNVRIQYRRLSAQDASQQEESRAT